MVGRLSPLLGCTVVALLAGVSAADAGGFALREQSAYGQGMSFAGVAAGGSLSTMFWNPATLSAVMGFELETVGTLIAPKSDVTLLGPDALPSPPFPGPAPTGAPSDEGDIAQDAFVPSGYGAYRINDRLVLGVGVNGPYGLVTKYDSDSILRATGFAGTAEIFSLNVNPSLSYQVTDWLAVAAGLQGQYIDVRYTAANLAPFGLPISSLEGDDIAVGLTAGVLLTPVAGTEIGLGLRSSIRHDLDAELSAGLAGSADVKGDGLDLPDIVTFGIRQQVTSQFRIMAGLEWSNWSNFDEITLEGSDDITAVDGDVVLPFEYNDGWFFSLGGEYDWNEKLTLRAGIGYELSPLDDENRTFRLPDNDRLWLSAGASYNLNDRFSFDLGYSFVMVDDNDIEAGSGFGGEGPDSNGPFFGESDAHVHIVSAGLKVKFGGPAAPVAAMPEPLVVKP